MRSEEEKREKKGKKGKKEKGKKNIHFDSRFIVVIRQERTAGLLDRLGGRSFASAERAEGKRERMRKGFRGRVVILGLNSLHC